MSLSVRTWWDNAFGNWFTVTSHSQMLNVCWFPGSQIAVNWELQSDKRKNKTTQRHIKSGSWEIRTHAFTNQNIRNPQWSEKLKTHSRILFNRPFYQASPPPPPWIFPPLFPRLVKRPFTFYCRVCIWFPSVISSSCLQSVSPCMFPLSVFSEDVILHQPCDSQPPLVLFSAGQKCIWWMLLTKVLDGIASAYKFSVDAPLGAKLVTLAGGACSARSAAFSFVL